MQAIRYFGDADACVESIASMRWPLGVLCPHCAGSKISFLKTRRIWKCMAKDCRKQFSVKTRSIFEDSPITLDKRLSAIWLAVNCKNGISSYELARDLKVTQKSAWFMLHRIRLALSNGTLEKMGGGGEPVEVDETFIGGKPKNMHRAKRNSMKLGEKWERKTIVMGLLDRETRKVRAKVIPNVKRETLQAEILDLVQRKAKVYTDGWSGYDELRYNSFIHETVTHIEEYVRGQVHTQGIENFWSLLKRGLNGTYVAVEPFHLSRYVDEQAFRFNNRSTRENPIDDADRFMLAVSQVAGKRLTCKELTGKVGETAFNGFCKPRQMRGTRKA